MKNEIQIVSQKHPILNQYFKYKIHGRTTKISNNV